MQGRLRLLRGRRERKGYPWKVFFPMKLFHYCVSEQQRMLYPRLCDCFGGYLWLSRVFRMIPAFYFAYLFVFCLFIFKFISRGHIIFTTYCFTDQWFFFCCCASSRFLGASNPSLRSCESVVYHLRVLDNSVSVAWRKTQFYQVVPQDHSMVLWISATLLPEHLT